MVCIYLQSVKMLTFKQIYSIITLSLVTEPVLLLGGVYVFRSWLYIL